MPFKFSTVFLSSTWEDLVEHRQKVDDALRQASFCPFVMERFRAAGRPPIEECLRILDQADIYVGVIGLRYGSSPSDSDKSYTQLEYEYARRKGIPTFIFIMSEQHPVVAKDVDRGDSAVQLEKFKQLLLRDNMARCFDSPDHLATEVLASLVGDAGMEPVKEKQTGSLESHITQITERFREFSAPLLQWPQTLVNGRWIDRPETSTLQSRIGSADCSVTFLLGPPGSGKSALLSRLSQYASESGFTVLAIKADYLPSDINSQERLARLIGVPDRVEKCIASIVEQHPVVLAVDQLDALSDLMDLRSGRLNVILDAIHNCRGLPRVHIVCSCREFEFQHDTRLSSLDAERLDLSLPSWDQVGTELAQVGITGSGDWPSKFRETLQTPQNLDLFLRRFRDTGQTDVFDGYQHMLDDLWKRKIDSDEKRRLIYELTELGIEQESLWLPAVRFEEMSDTADELVAAGVLERQGHRIGFRHQTMLEHAKARLFTRSNQSLAGHTRRRQDALFVRPTLWSTLTYLREADRAKYRGEIEELFQADLRLHLRYLLIDFLGQLNDPADFEVVLMADRLQSLDDRKRVLIAIRDRKAWFEALRKTHFPSVMNWPMEDLWPMVAVINDAWSFARDHCFELLDRYLLPYSEKDELTWRCLSELPTWDEDAVDRVCNLARRSVGGRAWWAEDLAYKISADQPELAPRVVSAVLGKSLQQDNGADTHNPTQSPCEDDDATFQVHDNRRSPLEETQTWHELPAVAEAAPVSFLQEIWPWFVAVAEQFHFPHTSTVLNDYGDWSRAFDREREFRLHYPIAESILAAVIGSAKADPEEFARITRGSWSVERQVVQIMLARGLSDAACTVPDVALEFICTDARRLQLGGYGRRDQCYARELITALAPHLDADGARRLENTILGWTQYRNGVDVDEEREIYARKARLRLLKAIPAKLLSPEAATFVDQEAAELPDWDRVPILSRAGRVRELPTMTKQEMTAASDESVIEAISKTSDSKTWQSEWSEQDGCFIREGGKRANVRELIELAKDNPQRIIKILPQLLARGDEAAVASTLHDLVDTSLPDEDIFALVLQLADQGASSEKFRSNAGYVLYKRCPLKTGLPDNLCSLLNTWLAGTWDQEYGRLGQSNQQSEDKHPSSILWDAGGGLLSFDRSFWVLLALSNGYLMRDPPDTDRWLSAIENHLDRHVSDRTWRSFCVELRWICLKGCDTSRGVAVIDKLLQEYPTVRDSREGVQLVANVADIMPADVVRRTLRLIRSSDWRYGLQAYGELIALIVLRDQQHRWVEELVDEILDHPREEVPSDVEEVIVGICFAAGRMWDESRARPAACRLLCEVIPKATERAARAIGTVFWTSDDFPADDVTTNLLNCISNNPNVLVDRAVSDLLGHLAGLVPHLRSPVLRLCQAILSKCSQDWGSFGSELYRCGPHLVNISMTLQRFNDTRADGLNLFEGLLRLGLDDAFKCLHDIDLRPVTVSRREPRKRRRRRRPT